MKLSQTIAAVLSALALGNLATAEDSLLDMLPEKLHNAKGEEVSRSDLEGKIVGLYFSAHWCPPCRAFTPSLVKFRDDNAENDFEIVFVSFDNSEDEKKTYIEEVQMKWLSIPGNRSEEGNAMAQKLKIRGIPALVILAPDGSIVTTDGRADVSGAPDSALEKWKAAKQS